MAECLEFGIGISSIVFVDINKYISPLFLKNEICTILSTAKNKVGCYKTNKQTQNKHLQMAQTICQIPAARNSPPKSLIPLKNPQRPRSRNMMVEASSIVQWLNVCVILTRLKIKFWPQPQASTTTQIGAS